VRGAAINTPSFSPILTNVPPDETSDTRTAGGIVATLPIRSLFHGKRRLAGHLSEAERTRLILHLCNTVVRALRDSGTVDMISLVSGDEMALRFARTLGLEPLREEEQELNGALHTAMAWASARADAHLIVLPDLPLLRAADIRQVVAAGSETPSLVLCPDHTGLGTNIMFARPCGVVPPLFGLGSLARHLEAGHAAGVPTTLIEAPGTRWDLDTPDDLRALELQADFGMSETTPLEPATTNHNERDRH
jgi:2-phospho-L-lactate/phosphoenolpyruvate guanylyltransferase